MNGIIKKLDQSTINKIAAGEIIVRPSAALKELIENSIDAGSTHIRITVEKGGMRLIEISDNGHGISVDDYPILCERFTTSKITKFNDLSSISSFGFRGEALASISFVSRVEVLSRVEGKPAFKASFKNGLLIEDEEISESERDVGTTISAHNIFITIQLEKMRLKLKMSSIGL